MAITTPQVFQTLAPIMHSGQGLNNAIGKGLRTYNGGVTALASGGATGAPVLTNGINALSVVATGTDSVAMPPSVPGSIVIIQNNGVAAAQVFANPVSSLASGVLDTLNGTAGATGIAVGNGKMAILICTAYGAWVGPVALA